MAGDGRLRGGVHWDNVSYERVATPLIGGDPTHGLQHVAEAGSDFLLTRFDSVYGSLGEHFHVHPILVLHFLRELSAEQWRLDSGWG